MTNVIDIRSHQAPRDRVRAAAVAKGYTVECPVLGLIKPGQCAHHRDRAFAATNPTRVALHSMCPGCGNNPRNQR